MPANSTEPKRQRPHLAALLLFVVFALPTAFFGWHQSQLRIDAQNTAMKSQGTREAKDTERLRRSFGSDQVILCALAAPIGIVIDSHEIERVRDLAKLIAAEPGVDRTSPVDARDPTILLFEVVLKEHPEAGNCASVAARIVDELRQKAPSTLSLRVTGGPLIESRIAVEVDRERSTIVPAIVVSLFLILLWIYRSLSIAVIILVPAGTSILWTGGLLQLLGHELDPLLVLLDPLVLTVAVAVSVHIVETFLRLRATLCPSAAAAAARRKLWEPVFLTTLTSMAGFFALLLSPIPAIANFGVFAALGVALSTCIATWCVPTWLAAFGPAPAAQKKRPLKRSPVFRYVAWMRASARSILLLGSFAAALLIMQSWAVEVDNDPLTILTAEDPVRADTEWLANRLGGVETIGMLIPANSPGAAPEMLALLTANLLVQPQVVRLAGPPLRANGSQALGLEDDGSIERIQAAARPNDGDILVQATIERAGSAAREQLFDELESFHTAIGCPNVHIAGTAVQIARDSGSLIRSQLLGLLLVIPLLGLMVGIGMRSVRLGLLSLIPNAMPCLLLHGGMVWADRSLSVATVMIGTVMMGLIVDDTIHILHFYRDAIRHGRSRRMAIADALRSSGRAITITSIVLFVGLGVGVLGSLSSTVEFSALAATTIAVAWLLDILILPCILLLRWSPRRQRRIRMNRSTNG